MNSSLVEACFKLTEFILSPPIRKWIWESINPGTTKDCYASIYQWSMFCLVFHSFFIRTNIDDYIIFNCKSLCKWNRRICCPNVSIEDNLGCLLYGFHK
jgi:hypothetical protein